MLKTLKRIFSFISTLIREPLVQFLLIGIAIFVVSEFAADWQDRRQQVILIDESLENYLENLYSAQFGVHADRVTLDRLLENYIREEVMYREALRLGLEEQDEIIRRRLVQKMEFLLKDNENISDPDETEIQAYYQQHAAEYTRPARVTFRHLYFSNDSVKEKDARQRAEDVLQGINSGEDKIAEADADTFPLNSHYADLEEYNARQLFGQTEFVQGLFDTPVGKWSGPYQSGYGWHLVLVENRTEASLLPFTDVKDSVISAWRSENSSLRFESVLQDLISRYEIQYQTGSAAK